MAVVVFSHFSLLNTQLPAQAQRFVGGDMSLLPQYEKYQVPYYDAEGRQISDVLQYMKSEAVGWNAQRVRLFVNPTPSLDYNDPAVCQDLDYVIAFGKRIKESGFAFMLDFHYSDTWADPAKQWTPTEWLSLSDEQLQQKLYDYTKDCLTKLVEAGATPDFIQTGNEISFGMLWGKQGTSANRCYINSSAANWNRFIALLQHAVKACREVCPEAKIIIHSERSGDATVAVDMYKRLAEVDYDVIGLSYYPFWHKGLPVLSETLNRLATNFPEKTVQIVEAAYNYQYLSNPEYDFSSIWPITPEGQAAFARDLVAELKKHANVNGLYWWFPEENGTGPNKSVTGGWLNRGLWDNSSHRALPALYELKSFLDNASAIIPRRQERIGEVAASADWYSLQGIRLSSAPSRDGLYLHGGQKVLLHH